MALNLSSSVRVFKACPKTCATIQTDDVVIVVPKSAVPSLNPSACNAKRKPGGKQKEICLVTALTDTTGVAADRGDKKAVAVRAALRLSILKSQMTEALYNALPVAGAAKDDDAPEFAAE